MRKGPPLAALALAAFGGCGPDIASGFDFSIHDLRPTADFAMHAADGGPDDLAFAADLTSAKCDLGNGPSGLLAAAVTSTNALYASLFNGSSWNDLQVAGTASLTDVALSNYAGVPFVVARQSDATLVASFFDGCSQSFAAPAPLFIGASTSNRPAVAGADVVFRGSVNGDRNLYHSLWNGTAWSPSVQQTRFTTTFAPTAVKPGGAIHTVFTGTDKTIYDGTVLDSAGGGTAAAFTGATTAHEPAAVVVSNMALLVFTGTDTNLYAEGSGFGTANATELCAGITSCVITSNLAPVASLDVTGKAIVAYVGKDPINAAQNYRIYTTTLTGTQWSAPVEASSGEITNLPPALAPGIAGDVAELLWVRASDGALRHARLTGAGWQTPVTVKAASFVSAPAALVSP